MINSIRDTLETTVEKLKALPSEKVEEVWMPVTVLGELYCGLRKCNNPEKERLRIGDLRERCLVVGVDEGAAIRYAEIYLEKEDAPSLCWPYSGCEQSALVALQYMQVSH